MLYTRSSRRLYCMSRTTSPPTRSTRLANTRASGASAPGRRGSRAGFPTADTAPPTPGHIPREFLVLHAVVHDGPASHSLRTPDHQVAREPQDHAPFVPVCLRGRQPHRGGHPGRRRAHRRCRARRISRR
ncbi:unnamed protein product, partial [Ectocarpus sp. 12 AP-2014]